jgi:hypothetical protein
MPLPTETQVTALILAGLRHLQADSDAGRDLSYLEQLADASLPADKDAMIDSICEGVNFGGLAGVETTDGRYWALFDRAIAWQRHEKSPTSAVDAPDLAQLAPAEIIELKRLHIELFGSAGRSKDDPRHAPRCQPGDTVQIRHLGHTGRVIMEDPRTENHPHVPGEAVWYLKLSNGAEGGGWRDSELLPLVKS